MDTFDDISAFLHPEDVPHIPPDPFLSMLHTSQPPVNQEHMGADTNVAMCVIS
ncbi:hypothetical protein M378DRAFT_163420 [Amanita muscaria Koide BX008]|uniref:Pheromone n=1 Tax=Amanita muscaria (strain Koide BX008) TaxID=946122 RepID=A0A0C2X6L8_AMAMK|nr:hypothetical protein M378DRAFT_163420 [Amanita muscaria Koide BX008]